MQAHRGAEKEKEKTNEEQYALHSKSFHNALGRVLRKETARWQESEPWGVFLADASSGAVEEGRVLANVHKRRPGLEEFLHPRQRLDLFKEWSE